MSQFVTVKLKGPFFTKNIPPVIKDAIVRESLSKFEDRLFRGGKGLGAKRNIISQRRRDLDLKAVTTLKWPRTKGVAWQRKMTSVIRAMSGRVLNKTAERIVGQLG